ncbi:FAD-binding protein [Paraburkholderia sp. 22098]|uniref:FAD-binding protein n=1 Tax=Paraburkholderia sp. 22098 TaxID=3453874 RepID=UPI003F87C969
MDSLLIVGAGVAGIAAALEAAHRGVKHVTVVETREAPFSILRGIKSRFIGPFMYEWPSIFSQNQSYPDHERAPWGALSSAPLQWTAKKPIPANDLAEKLEEDLLRRLGDVAKAGKSVLTICVGVKKHRIQNFVREFAQNESSRAMSRLQRRIPSAGVAFNCRNELTWPHGTAARVESSPQYVLLAAGMGQEAVVLVKEDASGNFYTGPNLEGPFFWADDTLKKVNAPNRQIGVFGGGDGALQDVLRALTRFDHPLEFVEFLEKDAVTKDALSRIAPNLLAADRQGRQFGTWTVRRGEYKSVDTVCKEVASKLASNPRVARRVSQGIAFGTGKVFLFVRGTNFDKAYLLNRFLVHLVSACRLAHKTMWSGRVDFEVRFQHHAVGYQGLVSGKHEVSIKRNDTNSVYHKLFDTIAVRYGITPGSIPGAQMIQVSTKMSRQRTSLSRIELPFVAEKD